MDGFVLQGRWWLGGIAKDGQMKLPEFRMFFFGEEFYFNSLKSASTRHDLRS